MKNPIKRQFREQRKIERIARDLKFKATRILSPAEIAQQKCHNFRGYYTFCMSVPSYKRKNK